MAHCLPEKRTVTRCGDDSLIWARVFDDTITAAQELRAITLGTSGVAWVKMEIRQVQNAERSLSRRRRRGSVRGLGLGEKTSGVKWVRKWHGAQLRRNNLVANPQAVLAADIGERKDLDRDITVTAGAELGRASAKSLRKEISIGQSVKRVQSRVT